MIEPLMNQQQSLASALAHTQARINSQIRTWNQGTIKWMTPLVYNGFVLLLFSLNYFTLECVLSLALSLCVALSFE